MVKLASSHDDEPRGQLAVRVRKAVQELVQSAEAMRDRAAKSQGLHSTDYACLSYLRSVGGPVSPKQINAQLNLSSGSGTALLDRLEAAGYTRRLPNPQDRRGLLIELNAEKVEETLKLLEAIEPEYQRVMQAFTDQELDVIARFLEKMSKFAERLG